MSNLFWLTKSQLNKIKPYFPPSRGVPRVDDLRVIRRGLQWRDAQKEYGPPKTQYKRFIRLWPDRVCSITSSLHWRRIATSHCAHNLFSSICIAAINIFYLNL